MLTMIASIVHDLVHRAFGRDTLADILATDGGAIGSAISSSGAWLMIQFMVFVYARAQVGQIQRENPAYDRVTRLLVAASTLSVLRLLAVSSHDLGLLAMQSLAIAIVLAVVVIRLRHEVLARRASTLLALPFSLLLGWSLLTAIATLTAAVTAVGGPGTATAVLLIVITAALVIYLGLELRDCVLPGLVGWLLTACAVHADVPVTTAALIAAAVCAVTAIVVAGARLAVDPAPRR
ncbi:MAG: hypothetical protein JWP01_1549 [Myxococcales bacterium]|nr:hypothetical protein [Myxococcales bacterium]